MQIKGSIFNKMFILNVVLLIPVILLYIYFNQISERNTKREIENASLGRLSFFLSQIETNLYLMDNFTGQIDRDPSLQEWEAIQLGSDYFDKWKTSMNLSEKLRLLSSSNKWENQITIYFPQMKELFSTDSVAVFHEEELAESDISSWSHRIFSINGKEVSGFAIYFVDPISFRSNPLKANFIIKISFEDRSLMTMLDQFKTSDNFGDPFFFDSKNGLILNRSADKTTVNEITKAIQVNRQGNEAWTQDIRANGVHYMVTVNRSSMLGMYLVNYYPMETALSSLHSSRSIFYLSIGMLLLISLIATGMFYRHVQTPIKELVRGVQRLKNGDYSFRIRQRNRSEFQFLFERFNEMAEEIQILIENVYEERLRSREAVLKQLQAQINPHFLYNSLNFIKTMSIVGNEDALVEMVVNLGEFYRYTTRSEKHMATVMEEVEFVRNYLSIQQLRMPRMRFTIDVPDALMNQNIPRILLQPIVENAIVHGIEFNLNGGILTLKGDVHGDVYRILIEDSGKGLSQEKMTELEKKLDAPLMQEMGCGVWNVHQRLRLEFGSEAGLSFFRSSLGGLGIILQWTDNKRGENTRVSNIDCR